MVSMIHQGNHLPWQYINHTDDNLDILHIHIDIGKKLILSLVLRLNN